MAGRRGPAPLCRLRSQAGKVCTVQEGRPGPAHRMRQGPACLPLFRHVAHHVEPHRSWVHGLQVMTLPTTPRPQPCSSGSSYSSCQMHAGTRIAGGIVGSVSPPCYGGVGPGGCSAGSELERVLSEIVSHAPRQRQAVHIGHQTVDDKAAQVLQTSGTASVHKGLHQF